MSTETEVKLARYGERVKKADKLGRIISVGRLKPSEQVRISQYTSELTGYDEMTNDKGDMVRIPHRLPLIIAASVRMIDDAHISFVRNRGELDAIYDRLDKEGLRAAGEAFAELNPQNEADLSDGTIKIDPLAETKNSSGTPSST